MSVGKISEFKIETDNWRLYVERLEQYFIVNNISREMQVPTLVTVMGARSYELIVNLCTPDKPTSKSFDELAVIMEKHLQPRPSILAERYKFHQRKPMKDEKISDYIAELKKMSRTCDFGQWLNESFRDRLVCGLASETIRQRLFAEDKLDFNKACSLAWSMEAAEKDAALTEGHSGSKMMSAECQKITEVNGGERGSYKTTAEAGNWPGRPGRPGRLVRPGHSQSGSRVRRARLWRPWQTGGAGTVSSMWRRSRSGYLQICPLCLSGMQQGGTLTTSLSVTE
ncbi:uncharacterized protein LOC131854416 [Achroia grisella]|uniref:uncharacterized protein LOC131854416 n=1 Tax=Achroia grisella TaxID=688607 RepID=UPI0027D322A5|nr:uncharacterized protein LOC131854416 [Achroia grisella]